MADVLVTEQIAGSAMEALKRDFDVALEPKLYQEREPLLAAAQDCRALIVRNQTQVDRELLAAAKRLEVIGRAGVGLDNVDVKTATDSGVVVVWTPEQNSLSVAELTIGLMLSLARRIPAADRSTRQGRWERQQFTGSELSGKTLGIVGLGRIGFLVATRAKAMGMRILAFDTQVSPDSFRVVESAAKLMSLDDLLAESDFVSVHLPATPQTRNLFNRERFARMKAAAFLINASRGDLVDEPALIAALRQKQIAGAALDVRATEPPDASALSEMDNVILTPHIAAFTVEGQRRVVESVCGDVGRVLKGESPRYFVNFPRPRTQTPHAE